MKRQLLIVAAVALASTVVLAGPSNIERVVSWFKGGVFIGSATVRATSSNKLAGTMAASTAYDFPDITNNCSDSWAVSIPGAAVGDVCSLGASVAPGANEVYSCYVSATNAAKVHGCGVIGDGGTVDPADAGFELRIFAN